MRSFVIVVVMALLLFASSAGAQDKYLAPDHIGIFTAPDGTGHAHVSTTTRFEPIEIYLVLINPSLPMGVSHWQCRINFLRYNVTAPQATLTAGTDLETANPWDFAVEIGTANPLPPADFVQLATISMLVDKPDGDPTFFYIDASCQDGMGLNLPCYAAGDDPQNWHWLVPTSQAKYFPVFAINATVLPTEATTWGHLKTLYQ